MAISTFLPAELPYNDGQKAGVVITSLAGLASLMGIICLFTLKRPTRRTFKNTHMFGYFMSLLFANVLQGIASVMDFGWVAKDGVRSGGLCSTQAGIQQFGNLGASILSLMIGLHLFHILFLRFRATNSVFIGALVSAWSFVLFIVLVGRFAMQNPGKGPYFGIAGSGCSITSNYAVERIIFEYLFSFISIGVGLILYVLVLLRVRGNLVRDQYHKWQIRLVKQDNKEKLAITQDTFDNFTDKLAQKMVWYPVSYAIILFPISVVHIAEFNGAAIPFWVTALTAFIFNFTGLVNVALVIYIGSSCPEPNVLPTFSWKYQNSQGPSSVSGDTPFTVGPNGFEEKLTRESSKRVVVKLPTKPQNTYIAPDSWDTTAPKGKLYH